MDTKLKLTAALKKAWGVKVLSYNAYDTELFYKTMEKYRDNEQPDSDDEIENFTRAIVICAVIEMERRWFKFDETGRYEYQKDILAQTVLSTSKYYSENQEAFLRHNSKPPITTELKEKLHNSIKWKARKEVLTHLRKVVKEENHIKNDQVKLEWEDRNVDANILTMDDIPDQHWRDKTEQTDLDDYIISTKIDNATINAESTDLISMFFLQHKAEVEALIPMFKNKRIAEMDPKNLWKIRVFNWEAATVYSYLEKIDQYEPLAPDEKGYLYMFYLMICITAIYNKRRNAVKGLGDVDKKGKAISGNAMVIGRKYIPTLTTLVIKTFLHYTKKLEEKVFFKFDPPPPLSPKEVKTFGNLIKDKPRKLLDTSVKLPPLSKKKSILAPSQKLMQAINSEEFEIPESFNFEEVFESYEVFAALTNNIMASFAEGRIKERSVDDSEALGNALEGMGGSELKPILKSVLSASGYKIEKDGESENGFIMKGLIGVEKTEKRIAVTFNCSEAFGKGSVESAKSLKKQHNTERIMMVGVKGFSSDFKEIRRKVTNYETWDLLDLVEKIQENYHKMSETEKKLIDDYIDKALDEF